MLKIYINNELLDYDGKFNLVASIGDIKNLQAGTLFKSYTLNIPLTPNNKQILGFVDDISIQRKSYTNAFMEYDEVIILRGSVLLLGIAGSQAKLIITAQDWIRQFDGLSLKDLTGLSTFSYTSANIVASWTASFSFIRYPLIDNGALASGEDGYRADWYYIDFFPWFQIEDIIAEIFKKYTIQSLIHAATKWKNTYISGIRKLNDPSFIEEKGLDVRVQNASDNQDTDSVPGSGGTGACTIDKDPVDLNNEVLDEGSDYLVTTDKYTVPETGNYRFKATIEITGPWTYGPITSSQYTIYIKGATIGIIATANCNQSDGSCITTVSLDTGYVQLIATDTIWLDVYVNVTMTNNDPNPRTFTLSLGTATKLELDWSAINLLPAEGTYDVVDWLPDMNQLTFLKGLKHAYNLLFFFDRENGEVYFEPADDFCTVNIKDITDRIIGKPSMEEIGSNYKKIQRLKWLNDSGDKALVDYITENAKEVGQKDIELTNENCEDGIETIPNAAFAPVAVGNSAMFWQYTDNIPRMWKSYDINSHNYPPDKLTQYIPRLAEWKGYSASVAWKYEGVNKSLLPQIASIDFDDQYSVYYLKTFYRINLGKLVTLEIISDVVELSEFITVLADDEKEGFRATYKAAIDGVELYFVLNKITHNGSHAKLELIQKV